MLSSLMKTHAFPFVELVGPGLIFLFREMVIPVYPNE